MNTYLEEILGLTQSERRRREEGTMYRTYSLSAKTVQEMERKVGNKSAFVDSAIRLALSIVDGAMTYDDVMDMLYVEGIEHLPDELEKAAQLIRYAAKKAHPEP